MLQLVSEFPFYKAEKYPIVWIASFCFSRYTIHIQILPVIPIILFVITVFVREPGSNPRSCAPYGCVSLQSSVTQTHSSGFLSLSRHGHLLQEWADYFVECLSVGVWLTVFSGLVEDDAVWQEVLLSAPHQEARDFTLSQYWGS